MKAEQKRKPLLELPVRNWQTPSTYRGLLIVPTGKKHDSGWHLIAIVGLGDDAEPLEIAAYCDDIGIKVEGVTELPEWPLGQFRIDMTYPSGIARWWNAEFTVGVSLSSTEIIIKEKKRNGNS